MCKESEGLLNGETDYNHVTVQQATLSMSMHSEGIPYVKSCLKVLENKVGSNDIGPHTAQNQALIPVRKTTLVPVTVRASEFTRQGSRWGVIFPVLPCGSEGLLECCEGYVWRAAVFIFDKEI
ncbi:hypothetical protein AFLA_009079 [Aspergillus flavus NRRL3357]|nr:hypothetical protein AFLA_009079 [Aspergillus flavus NRRL3357]